MEKFNNTLTVLGRLFWTIYHMAQTKLDSKLVTVEECIAVEIEQIKLVDYDKRIQKIVTRCSK